ncbi:serine/threonine-protein kinase [Streptomyces sp. NPDC048507]|uniref:serine/threonine-protein kinase n=1 Tax=Streptomyces sp. NPDC048507 TaxID=3365560 RepID=UPI0037195D36
MSLPERIGGYAIERELGSGGMGTVYLARSRGGRTVAVKVARSELAADPHFRARFRAEVEAARKVGGFHTAPVVDADPDAETPWLATAYIAGPTLSELIVERGPMDEPQLRLLGAALAEALQAIHACGLVHRDLKPGNIIMADDGPRVLDFGIARALESSRLTSTGTAFGTPGFLAPEQAQGLEVGSAADVFALGAVLVAAAGGSAFGAGTPMGLMYRSVHEQPDLSALPQGIRPAVAGCLAKNPAQRPTLEALLDLFAPEPIPEPGPEPAPYTPTVPAPAVAVANAPTVGAVPHAEAQEALPAPVPPGNPGKKRTGLLAVGVAVALVAVGGAIYGAYTLTGDDSVGPFPPATHKLAANLSLADGAYTRTTESLLEHEIKGSGGAKDSTYLAASYTGGEKALFREMHFSGTYGRFQLKHPKQYRESTLRSMTVTGSETVNQPPKDIRPPGSDVDFTCTTVTGMATQTVCAWVDDNTEGGIAFTSGSSSNLDDAAAEAARVRKSMREPIHS